MPDRDINMLLDDLGHDVELQREWELNPDRVAKLYNLTPEQVALLRDGDVDGLIAAGLAERHTQQMRVSW